MFHELALDIPDAKTATRRRKSISLSVLSTLDGDAFAAIRNLLADADFLRDQLYTAPCIMSAGMGRDCNPKYERVG